MFFVQPHQNKNLHHKSAKMSLSSHFIWVFCFNTINEKCIQWTSPSLVCAYITLKYAYCTWNYNMTLCFPSNDWVHLYTLVFGRYACFTSNAFTSRTRRSAVGQRRTFHFKPLNTSVGFTLYYSGSGMKANMILASMRTPDRTCAIPPRLCR